MLKLRAFGRNILVRVVRVPGDEEGDVLGGVVMDIGPKSSAAISVGDMVLFDDFTDLGFGVFVIQTPDIVAVVERSDERDSIYNEIEAERVYQEASWGGGQNLDREDWVRYINEYAYAAGEGRAEGDDFRMRMMKVAALAVGAIEAEDRKGDATDDAA